MAKSTDDTEETDLRKLIEAGYDELQAALGDPETATEEIPAIVPSELEDPEAKPRTGFDREARTVLVDAQSAAIEYAVAKSLNPDLGVEVPDDLPDPKQRAASASLRVVVGRMDRAPPLNQNQRADSRAPRIVKGSKIPK